MMGAIRAISLPLALLGALATAACEAPRILSTTRLGDTYDRQGPYGVIAEVADPDGLERVDLIYIAGSTAAVFVEMNEVRDGIYEGSIPGQPAFTRVQYYVIARDGDTVVTDPANALSGDRFVFAVLGSPCSGAGDCGPGEFCDASARCRQKSGSCAVDTDCGKGFRCAAGGACVLAVRSCALDEGCLPGEVCDQTLGQCIPRPRCDGGSSCPLDFSCDPGTRLCRRACLTDQQCGPGESCSAGVCSGATSCTTSADCPSALLCDPLLSYCRPRGAGPCAPCQTDGQCGGPTDFCLMLDGGDLACGLDCSNRPCPAGMSCDADYNPPQCAPTSGSCSP